MKLRQSVVPSLVTRKAQRQRQMIILYTLVRSRQSSVTRKAQPVLRQFLKRRWQYNIRAFLQIFYSTILVPPWPPFTTTSRSVEPLYLGQMFLETNRNEPASTALALAAPTLTPYSRATRNQNTYAVSHIVLLFSLHLFFLPSLNHRFELVSRRMPRV